MPPRLRQDRDAAGGAPIPAAMTGLPAVGLIVAAGLAVGSFLNVCIHRLPRGESVVAPPSRCPACGRDLRWFENVPVLSWMVLRGRCRTCRAAISPAYPLVEIVTALVFVLHYRQLGWEPLLAVRLLFAASMIVLGVIDLRHRILPDVITLPGVAAGVGCSLWGEPGWHASVAGAVAGWAILGALGEAYFRMRGHEGMGRGDMKMLAMIGAFLGWRQMFVTLLIASLSGSLVGGAMVLWSRDDLKYALPFGSFLAAGALLSTHVAPPLIQWYLGRYW